MSVISNSSPIIALTAIERINLLQQHFGHILIPPAVEQETLAGELKSDFIISRTWIDVIEVQSREKVNSLRTHIDLGEAEAIILAEEQEADVLILDDRAGRNAAKDRNFNVIGTLGILLLSKYEDGIDSVRQCIQELEKNKFRVSDKLKRKILEKAGELKT